ncbi:LAME_0B01794g1_1 [Lachancea meyersii CBS 8951]|uniref:LAME_0B01794g1_1 n=1 Tax=Lachancea meyersii CBS 8951 TaxID=1266667 RepID=A0A1G4ITY5_9SACH|nr:LAME_0B01794g1_1 [Lachancea meyersii CBS 8951]
MKFSKSKRKGSKKRAFGNANDESDNSDQEESLEQFMKRKSAKIAEGLPQTEELKSLGNDNDRGDKIAAERRKRPDSSKLIDKFKAAKEQRDLDKLYHQSLKAELENQNDELSQKSESYISDSYKEKKEALDRVSEAARLEELEENADASYSRSAATAHVNRFLIQTDSRDEYSAECSKSPARESNASKELVSLQKGPYQNDVYVGKPAAAGVERRASSSAGLAKAPLQLSELGHRTVIAKFLASTKTFEELEHQKQLYLARRSMES